MFLILFSLYSSSNNKEELKYKIILFMMFVKVLFNK